MKNILLFISLLTILFALCACSSSEHLHEYEVQSAESFEATCEKDGKTVYKCKDESCGYTYSKTLPKGHVWKSGNCTTPKTCDICKKTDGEAIGHIYENKVCVTCKQELAIDLALPEVSSENPLTLKNFKGAGVSEYKINNLSYTFDGTRDDAVTVTIVIEGEKVSDTIYGDGKDVVGKIAYKIYDEEGFVIFSSTKDTMMLKSGEKFKNLKIALSGFNAGQKYVLEFFDYYS